MDSFEQKTYETEQIPSSVHVLILPTITNILVSVRNDYLLTNLFFTIGVKFRIVLCNFCSSSRYELPFLLHLKSRGVSNIKKVPQTFVIILP